MAPRYTTGDWVAIDHPKTKNGTEIPLKDFKMWDMAFEAKHSMSKAEAASALRPHSPESIFIVLRHTTRRSGKKRLKVLNPYSGKSKAIFNEQVKARLSLNLNTTQIDRWLLLAKYGEHSSPLYREAAENNSVLHNEPFMVQGIDPTDPFFNDLDETEMQFLDSSYFGAACLMCPQNAYPVEAEEVNTLIGEEDVDKIIHTLMQSLGMDGVSDGLTIEPENMKLIMGVPHFNRNLTKMYKSKNTLGAILKVPNSHLKYCAHSLYNKQAPNGMDTKSAEDGEAIDGSQLFYAPFNSLNHHYKLVVPEGACKALFGNYPEHGAGHLLEALQVRGFK